MTAHHQADSTRLWNHPESSGMRRGHLQPRGSFTNPPFPVVCPLPGVQRPYYSARQRCSGSGPQGLRQQRLTGELRDHLLHAANARREGCRCPETGRVCGLQGGHFLGVGKCQWLSLARGRGCRSMEPDQPFFLMHLTQLRDIKNFQQGAHQEGIGFCFNATV